MRRAFDESNYFTWISDTIVHTAGCIYYFKVQSITYIYFLEQHITATAGILNIACRNVLGEISLLDFNSEYAYETFVYDDRYRIWDKIIWIGVTVVIKATFSIPVSEISKWIIGVFEHSFIGVYITFPEVRVCAFLAVTELFKPEAVKRYFKLTRNSCITTFHKQVTVSHGVWKRVEVTKICSVEIHFLIGVEFFFLPIAYDKKCTAGFISSKCVDKVGSDCLGKHFWIFVVSYDFWRGNIV